MCRQPTESRSLHPVYHLPPPPTSCLASHVSSPLCACVQALAAFCRLNSSAPVTCYRQPRRVRQAATAHVPPPSTPAPVRSAQNIFAPATARRVCDCIINGRRACMRGGLRGGAQCREDRRVRRGRGRGMWQVRSEPYVALLLLHGAPQVQAASVRQAAQKRTLLCSPTS